MRIAQVSPLAESVPPKLYGGTERVVSWLTEELVRQGHEVTLFASGDSRTSARLVPVTARALRLDPAIREPLGYHIMLLEEVRKRAHEFDIVHFHLELLHAPLARSLGVPSVTTLHGRLDLPDLPPFYRRFPELPLVSISDFQRLPLPPVNWAATIYHGMPPNLLPARLQPSPGEPYLAFLGRISPEKRPDRAIEIAARAGMKIRIAAKIDQIDRQYWAQAIEPLIARHGDLVEFIGEIDDRQKADFLGNARALLFPIDWPEPFGLVMIEAMACGTPVIAFPHGSVGEVIDHGLSGFIVESIEEAVAAVGKLDSLPRAEVHKCFCRRFTVERMAADYVSLYRKLAGESRPAAGNVLRLQELDGMAAPKIA